jgi:hypothetical protein
LGLLQGTHPYPNDLPASIHIHADRVLNVGTDRSQPLSKLRGGNTVPRQPLMVQPLQLLDLAGLKPLQVAVNGFDSVVISQSVLINYKDSVLVLLAGAIKIS